MSDVEKKRVAVGRELLAQLAVVVDAAVEDDGEAELRVDHRLGAALGEVDDLQPPVRQPDAVLRPGPGPSGPRGARPSAMRSSAATSAARPSKRSSPRTRTSVRAKKDLYRRRLASAGLDERRQEGARGAAQVAQWRLSRCHWTPTTKSSSSSRLSIPSIRPSGAHALTRRPAPQVVRRPGDGREFTCSPRRPERRPPGGCPAARRRVCVVAVASAVWRCSSAAGDGVGQVLVQRARRARRSAAARRGTRRGSASRAASAARASASSDGVQRRARSGRARGPARAP